MQCATEGISHFADSFSVNGKISFDITTQNLCGIIAKCYFITAT